MAGKKSRTQQVDQWRPEDKDHSRSTQRPNPAPTRHPAASGKDLFQRQQQPSLDQRARSRSRDTDSRRREGRRRSRSLGVAQREDDRYRPARTQDRTSPRISHYSPDRRGGRRASRSPPRREARSSRERYTDRERNSRRSRSPPRRAPSPRRDLNRAYPPPPARDRYRSSSRRRSPDHYHSSSRRQSPAPLSSSYRPELRIRGQAERVGNREQPRSPRRSSAAPSSDRRSPPRRDRRPQDCSSSSQPKKEEPVQQRNPAKRRRISASPPPAQHQLRRDSPHKVETRQPGPRSRSRSKEKQAHKPDSPRGRKSEKETDMAHFRGSSRGGRGGHGGPYGHTPPAPFYPPEHGLPYDDPRGVWPPYGHAGSPPLYPPGPMPYQQPGYPPVQSPYYPQVPPPPQYAGSPIYPPSYPPSYPPTAHRSNSIGHHQSPRSDSSRGNRARGTFTNLSWTPTTGVRGGTLLPPKSKKSVDGSGGEEEDNPFRPSKDLRAEDEQEEGEEREDPETQPTKQEGNKIAFGFKKMAKRTSTSVENTPTDLAALAKLRKQNRQAEKKPLKRIRPRPTLAPELAASDSVYYRKPGNESVVGSGTYGKVFRAIHVYTGEKVALKKIRMEGERDGFPVTAIREIKLLQSLKNVNVVRLQEVMVEKNDCYMVFEYLSHDLTGLLNHPTFKLEHSHKKHLAKQLFEGLDYLHKRGVLHRDIKAANILISNTGQLKIADFGLARFYAKRKQLDYTNRVITIWYRSPELLLGETQYGPAVDIWSAACVLVEIFTRHAIFPGNGGEIDQLDKIYNVLGTPTKTEWPGIVDMAWFELLRPTERKPNVFAERYKERTTPAAFELLQAMFAYDPTSRPSASDVLAHAYFTEEEPQPVQASELANLQGDWHEFESKALRKEKEKVEREARKAREQAEREGKRKSGAMAENGHADDERRAKKVKTEQEIPKEKIKVEQEFPGEQASVADVKMADAPVSA